MNSSSLPGPWFTTADDLTITLPATTLNVRVGALLEHNNKILVEQSRWRPGTFFLPGGRIKANESSEQALWRELEEECGMHKTSATLWAVIENFFTVQDLPVHELSFYYRVTFPAPEHHWWNTHAAIAEGSPESELLWLPLDRCTEETMLPSQLAQRIVAGDRGFSHSIFR